MDDLIFIACFVLIAVFVFGKRNKFSFFGYEIAFFATCMIFEYGISLGKVFDYQVDKDGAEFFAIEVVMPILWCKRGFWESKPLYR